MKKNFYWMFAAILFCSAMTTVFTSCSKDDDNNTPEPQKEQITAKKATAWYAASMGEDMLDVFDVEVTTSGPQIGKETRKLTKTKFSMADNDANVNDAGLVFTMSVKLRERQVSPPTPRNRINWASVLRSPTKSSVPTASRSLAMVRSLQSSTPLLFQATNWRSAYSASLKHGKPWTKSWRYTRPITCITAEKKVMNNEEALASASSISVMFAN